MQIQFHINIDSGQTVVICFKFSNFAYANTVMFIFKWRLNWLLFALNLVILLMQIQCRTKKIKGRKGCYLL